MNRIYKNLVNCSVLGVALLLGTTACSDDHFDVKGLSGIEGSSTTIWESIVAQDSILSDARSILERTHVMVDERDKKASLTYAEWLNQPMEITVWLPKNNTFNEEKEYFLSLLDKADSLRQDSLALSLRLEYQVVSQFVKNHISLFNSTNAVDNEVRLLNSKNCTFDRSADKFNGVSYDPNLTTFNRNGALYVLTEGASPYAYNVYDFMSSSPDFSSVFNIISDPSVDKSVFWPEASTEGAVNEKGEIVYVDSVYRNSNELLSRANALIKSEDSLYIAFIPTNEAWDVTMETVRPLFNYGELYHYEWDNGKFLNTGSRGLTFNGDSLQEVSARAQIIESMFFNVTDFHLQEKTEEAIFNHIMTADSLISTNGVVYYNSNPGGNNPMFEGLDFIKASNGYVFTPRDCRIDPNYCYIRRTETRPSAILAEVTNGNMKNVYLNAENWQKDSVYGEVQDDWYNFFERSSGSMIVRLKLNNLACGHYKISAQMLPNRINKLNVTYGKDNITQLPEKCTFHARLFLDHDLYTAATPNDAVITLNQDSVQNVVLFDDFELKKSYKKLPAGYETFAILEFEQKLIDAKRGKCKGLSIAKIVVEPVRK